MRLIDADALVERLEKSHEYHAKTSREEVLLFRDIRIINEQPTAYDVEAVLEQLEKERDNYKADWNQFDNEDDFGGMCAMGRAIEIVRAGGKMDDQAEAEQALADKGV